MFLILGLTCMALACLLYGYQLIFGVPDFLRMAKVGNIYTFRTVQPLAGSPEIVRGRILSVRRLSPRTIRRITNTSNYRADEADFQRSTNLVTVYCADRKIRNYYAERTVRAKRFPFARSL